jgi:hypothetical protein
MNSLFLQTANIASLPSVVDKMVNSMIKSPEKFMLAIIIAIIGILFISYICKKFGIKISGFGATIEPKDSNDDKSSKEEKSDMNNSGNSNNNISINVGQTQPESSHSDSTVNTTKEIDTTVKQAAQYAADYQKDHIRLKSELLENQMSKTETYLQQSVAGICVNYQNQNLSNIKIRDLSDLLELYLNRDFNELIKKQIRATLKQKILGKENDEFIRQEVERITNFAVQSLRRKFIQYPSYIDQAQLMQIFNDNESLIKDAISNALIDCKKLSIKELQEEERLRSEYDMNIQNCIQHLIQPTSEA